MTDALASYLGLPLASVAAAVQSVELSTKLTLASTNGASSMSDNLLAMVTSSLATSLSVAPQQVHAVLLASAQQRRHLSQSSTLQIAVTVTGLTGAADVASASSALVAPATLTSLLASLNTPAFSGVTASPASVAVLLLVAVQVPASQLVDGIHLALAASRASNLTAALQAAGVGIAAVSVLVQPVFAAPSPLVLLSPPPAAMHNNSSPSLPVAASSSPWALPPATVKDDTVIAIAVGLSLFFTLLVCGAAVYWRRRMHATKSTLRSSTRSFSKMVADLDDEPRGQDDSFCVARPRTKSQTPALCIASENTRLANLRGVSHVFAEELEENDGKIATAMPDPAHITARNPTLSNARLTWSMLPDAGASASASQDTDHAATGAAPHQSRISDPGGDNADGVRPLTHDVRVSSPSSVAAATPASVLHPPVAAATSRAPATLPASPTVARSSSRARGGVMSPRAGRSASVLSPPRAERSMSALAIAASSSLARGNAVSAMARDSPRDERVAVAAGDGSRVTVTGSLRSPTSSASDRKLTTAAAVAMSRIARAPSGGAVRVPQSSALVTGSRPKRRISELSEFVQMRPTGAQAPSIAATSPPRRVSEIVHMLDAAGIGADTSGIYKYPAPRSRPVDEPVLPSSSATSNDGVRHASEGAVVPASRRSFDSVTRNSSEGAVVPASKRSGDRISSPIGRPSLDGTAVSTSPRSFDVVIARYSFDGAVVPASRRASDRVSPPNARHTFDGAAVPSSKSSDNNTLVAQTSASVMRPAAVPAVSGIATNADALQPAPSHVLEGIPTFRRIRDQLLSPPRHVPATASGASTASVASSRRVSQPTVRTRTSASSHPSSATPESQGAATAPAARSAAQLTLQHSPVEASHSAIAPASAMPPPSRTLSPRGGGASPRTTRSPAQRVARHSLPQMPDYAPAPPPSHTAAAARLGASPRAAASLRPMRRSTSMGSLPQSGLVSPAPPAWLRAAFGMGRGVAQQPSPSAELDMAEYP